VSCTTWFIYPLASSVSPCLAEVIPPKWTQSTGYDWKTVMIGCHNQVWRSDVPDPAWPWWLKDQGMELSRMKGHLLGTRVEWRRNRNLPWKGLAMFSLFPLSQQARLGRSSFARVAFLRGTQIGQDGRSASMLGGSDHWNHSGTMWLPLESQPSSGCWEWTLYEIQGVWK